MKFGLQICNARRRLRKSPAWRTAVLPVRLASALANRSRYNQVIVHDGRFTLGIPPALLIRLFCGDKQGRLRKPADLTILQVHNRPYKTLMELSLDYLGIADYTVLRQPADQPWKNTRKITAIRDYLRSGACTTEYVLYVDSDDAIMRDDPAIAIALLNEAQCDMLVSTTRYARYRNMPDIKKQTIAIAPDEFRNVARPRIHLNAGVLVGRTSFMAEYFDKAGEYVSDNDLKISELTGLTDEEVLALLPDFPKGIGSDQAIMRYLFVHYYPRMKLDYRYRLAAR